ncbi:MAG: SMC family ATPase, partial [Gammaproteobacteria bacterium]|nr:SMC family ATPase [Gammaproteobacteria bacterium]
AAALRQAEAEAGECRSRLEAEQARVAAAVSEAAAARERVNALEREAVNLAADVERAKSLEDDLAQWQLLTKALSQDGIVALCIDDAGPTLTSIANDLLAACYGPRFTVSIKTQAETKAGTLRETFDIVVYDADRGDEKSIRDVSGGERVYLNEAVTRAIALYQAQASGRRYGCLFSDESDGALDVEKKRQFARMKRAVCEIGGYQRELYISHSPEVQEAADASIDVGALRAA